MWLAPSRPQFYVVREKGLLLVADIHHMHSSYPALILCVRLRKMRKGLEGAQVSVGMATRMTDHMVLGQVAWFILVKMEISVY